MAMGQEMGSWMVRVMVAFAASLPMLGTHALADVPQELTRAEAAVVAAWSKAPLGIRRAVFVASPPEGFGIYEPRSSNRFRPGETLLVYAEPIGFGWKSIGGDRVEFGFDVDFVVKERDGTIVGGKDKFARLVLQSRNRNREFMLKLSLNLTGAPPGDYVLQFRLRDIASDKSTSFELPFTIVS